MCRICGEDWPTALYHDGDLCRNHALLEGVSKEPSCQIIDHCPICGRHAVPAQWHHPATERQQARHAALKHLGILVCLNCHGVLTERQCTGWGQGWRKEDRPVRCIFQGLLTSFGCGGSGRVTRMAHTARELVHVVSMAALALADTWGLRGGEAAL